MDYLRQGVTSLYARCGWPCTNRSSASTDADSITDDSSSEGPDIVLEIENGLPRLDLDPKALKKSLKRGTESEKDAFVEYYSWCTNRIKSEGMALEDHLREHSGKFGPTLTKWMNRSCFTQVINQTDKSSRCIRETFAEAYRKCVGVSKGANPPDKAKDAVSSRMQALAYPAWKALQDIRVPCAFIIIGGMLRGVYPGGPQCTTNFNGTEFAGLDFNRTSFNGSYDVSYFNGTYSNGTYFDGNFSSGQPLNGSCFNGTGFNAKVVSDSIWDNYIFYDVIAKLQIVCTFVTLVPYAFLHMPAQFRQLFRERAAINRASDTALHYFADAFRYMTEEKPEARHANAYVMAMPGWRTNVSKAAQHDVRRMYFASLREGIFFPVNLTLSLVTSYNLVTGQTVPGLGNPYTSGKIQFAGGMFGLGQGLADNLQSYSEFHSAFEKLRTIRGSIENLRNVPRSTWINTVEKEPVQLVNTFPYAASANRDAQSYQIRHENLQSNQWKYAVVRGVKGWLGFVTSGLAVYYGLGQMLTGAKAPIYALVSSNLATFFSGQYYISSTLRMWGIHKEKVTTKRLLQNAQFLKLIYTADEILSFSASNYVTEYEDYKNLFQGGRLGEKISRKVPFANNECVALEIMTAYILGELNSDKYGPDEDVIEQVLKLPFVKWLCNSWKAPASEIEALLRACCDKAIAFQINTFREVLAKILRMTLPKSSDDMEKRIKPSVLVLAKMRIFEVGKVAPGKSFRATKNAYRRLHAAGDWANPMLHKRLMLGTNREEFISSVFHVYAKAKTKMPKNLLPEHIKFAKLLAIAEHAYKLRKVHFDAVVKSKIDDWPFTLPADFPEFKEGVASYLAQRIYDRVEQARALKKLATNETMKEIHLWCGGDVEYLRTKMDGNLFSGMLLLVDRVDRNQPIFTEPPYSPRGNRGGAEDSSSTSTQVTHSDTSTSDSESDADEKSDSEGAENGAPELQTVKTKDADFLRRIKRRSFDGGPKWVDYNDDDNDRDNPSGRNAGALTTSTKATRSGRRSYPRPLADARTDLASLHLTDTLVGAMGNHSDSDSKISDVDSSTSQEKKP